MRFSQRLSILGAVAALAITLSLFGWQQAHAQYPPTIGSLTATANPSPADTNSEVDVTCTVRDTSGSPVAGEPCTFTIVSQPGNDASVGSLSTTKSTNSQGTAVAVLRTGSTPGTVVVRVEARGISSQVSVSVVEGEEAGAPSGLPSAGTAPADESGGGFPGWLAIVLGMTAVLGAAAFLTVRAVRRQG